MDAKVSRGNAVYACGYMAMRQAVANQSRCDMA